MRPLRTPADSKTAKAAAWWSGSIDDFQVTTDSALLSRLSHRATMAFRVNEPAQLRAWAEQLIVLRTAVALLLRPEEWRLLLEFQIPRLGGRIDAVFLSPRGIYLLEFKIGAVSFRPQDQRQLEEYALDLQDFHAGSRLYPIVPILVATMALSQPQTFPLLLPGVVPSVLTSNVDSLGSLLVDLDASCPGLAYQLDVQRWEHAPYHPVPNIVEAACLLFSRHSVADIASARADATNLTQTANRIASWIEKARTEQQKLILFVTGIPGAGKTLCGLNAAFAAETSIGAAFLTGNPTLVHVLREALVRDAVQNGELRRNATRRLKSVIQPLPKFRDDLAYEPDAPPEHIIIIDEAQRSWTAAHAIARTQDRPVKLDRSEPALILDIMARHPDFACVVCLIGQGQEIHNGEGGLAEWGEALRTRPEWQVTAAPQTAVDPEPRNRLAGITGVIADPSLHLSVPVRSLRHSATPAWVDAVLRGDAADARNIVRSAGRVPFRLTRSLPDLRTGLRAACRNIHRSGLVCSAAAGRLRAEGLGVELPHMEEAAVAHWFLDRFPQDVRASDALEQVATQFSVQGLELDHVGVCWDGDLIRLPGRQSWQVRSFRGTDWQLARQADTVDYRVNTYRVLLTRARYETILWVPRGDCRDRTRDPAIYDAIAAFLLECGVEELTEPQPSALMPRDAGMLPLQPF